MATTHPDVDKYIRRAQTWGDELRALRSVLLDSPLTEDFKWRAPCYTFQNGNVAMIAELKSHCTLSFFKGVLLKDSEGILQKPGENSRSARVIPFTDVRHIKKLSPVLSGYLHEAIDVEKAGLKVDFKQTRELDLPAELEQKFREDSALKNAFEGLTPGRQRAYVLHFSGAKQSQTRIARIEKYAPRILDGKGINDCVCGLSGKMPSCDGSHKSLR